MPGNRENRVPRTLTSLWEHFNWQFDFLSASLERYEAGHEHEALRIATIIRILCHDNLRTGSKSLLGQLDVREDWAWLDTATPPEGAPRMPWGALVIEAPKGYGPRYSARVQHSEIEPNSFVGFNRWWTTPTFHDYDGNDFSRKTLVLSVANQDGGAHVDSALGASYHALAWDLSAGFPGRTADVNRVVRTPVWELLRQIAYEVQYTAHQHCPERAEPPTTRPETTFPTAVHISSWAYEIPLPATPPEPGTASDPSPPQTPPVH